MGRKSWLSLSAAICLAAQVAVGAQFPTPMAVAKTRFQMRLGEPVEFPAAADTRDFLLHAKTVRVLSSGKELDGLRVAPNETQDGMVLVPSAQVTPGDYAVTLSATSESGEERATSLAVSVRPRATIPKGSARPPVVLLNGWQMGFTNSCPVASSSVPTFGNLAQQLVDEGVPVVFLFDNCAEGPNRPIEELGNSLKTFLNTIKFDDGSQVQQIDLVGFSLGGLIARAYLAGLQPNLTYTPPGNPLIRKLILLATPNFGSYMVGNSLFLAGSQGGELSPGSSFLWNLATWNQRGDDLHGVDAIAIAGNAGIYNPPFLSSGVQIANGGDGVVSLNSASIGFVSQQSGLLKAERTRVIPYCHVDPSAFTNINLGTYFCSQPGIARVVTTGHLTSQIVRSFLAGTDTWKSIGTAASDDQYLKAVGGAYFGMQNASGGYVSDLGSVTWGNVYLSQGASLGTIFFTEFVSGSDRYIATSASLRAVDCGILKGAVGFIAATRCKIGTALVSVTPLSTAATGLAVTAGTVITLNGLFGEKCSNCQVVATPAGSTTPQVLTVNSWSNTAIQVQLPASLTGYSTLTVNGAPGNDSLGIFAVAAAAPTATLNVTPNPLEFSYTIGGALPDARSLSIAASDSTALAWTASASETWLSLSASSGTAPSSVDVSVPLPPQTAGTYSGTVTITSAGASNSPVSIPVTLTVTAAPPALIVSPLAVAFNYTAGGAVPAAQAVSVTSTGGTLTWTASSAAYWAIATKDSGSPNSLSIAVQPQNLAAGTYSTNVSITPDSGIPVTVAVTITVGGTRTGGTITGVTDAVSFRENITAAGWVAIFGSNLSGITTSWQGSDFVEGRLPTSLAGVSVTINGIGAYISFVSPGQINVLAPDDATTGPVQVQVTTAGQASNSFTAQKAPFAPAFFTFYPTSYIAALHLPDYSYVGKPNLVAGSTFTPARPGETILLYAGGLGPTNPPAPTGQLLSGAPPLANFIQITIGGVAVTADFVGLSSSGLYQFNVKVPDLPDGDAVVVATIGGVSTQAGTAITIQK